MGIERIAILGCGLIGGSFGLGLKAGGFGGEIIGWDRATVLGKAKERGAIDRGGKEVVEVVANADLIYLATPVGLILELLPTVGRKAKAGALVTDAGSTKARICRLGRQAVREGVHFLGGHPLAGKEVAGIENAQPDLFAGSKYVVIGEAEEAKDRRADPSLPRGMTEVEEEFLGWVQRLGAEPVWLDAETHDWAVALVSHLPQLTATAMAAVVGDETDEDGLPVSLAASGFHDMARLAGSSYEVWRDICLTNSENIGRALERLEQRLERLRTLLGSKELAEEFRSGQETWKLLNKTEEKESDG